jgi:3-dehydroquinate dehydratase
LLKGFREQGLVIHVLREKDAVLTYLRDTPHFPPFIHETTVEAWDRREVLFRECCSFEFVSLTVPIPPSPEDSKEKVRPEQTLVLKPVEEDFFRLLRFIHGVDTNKVALARRGRRSYYLPLTFEDLRQVTPLLEEISLGVDLWELRVDLLTSYDPTFLAFQVATLRRHSTHPILFTIRTQNHGGMYPDVPSNDEVAINTLHSLLDHALRLGVEYIDLEVTFPQSVISDIIRRKRNTTIIGSYQDWKGSISWLGPETRLVYDRIVRMGADIVKIVSKANSFEDNTGLRQFAAIVERNAIPLLAFNLGAEVISN